MQFTSGHYHYNVQMKLLAPIGTPARKGGDACVQKLGPFRGYGFTMCIVTC